MRSHPNLRSSTAPAAPATVTTDAGGSQKPTASRPRGIVFWLLGLTVAYQVVYQGLMWRWLRRHDEDVAAAACHDLSLPRDSPQCFEAQLFQSWAALDQAGGKPATEHQLPKAPAPARAFAAEDVPAVTPGGREAGSIPGGFADVSKDEGAAILAEATAAADRSHSFQEEFDRLYEATAASLNHSDSGVEAWRAELEALQHRFEERDAGRHSRRANHTSAAELWARHLEQRAARVATQREHAKERQERLDKLFNEAEAAIHSSAGRRSAFAQGLLDMQAKLQEQLDRLPSSQFWRRREEENQMRRLSGGNATSASTSGSSSLRGAASTAKATVSPVAITAWARNLQQLQAQLQAQYENLSSTRRHRVQASTEKLDHLVELHEQLRGGNATAAAHPVTNEAKKEVKRDELTEQIQALLRELCREPQRRNYPACIRARGDAEATTDTPSAKVQQPRPPVANRTSHRLWEAELTKKAMALGREMCEEPARRGYAACAQFLVGASSTTDAGAAVAPAAAEPAVSATPGESETTLAYGNDILEGLQWRAVRSWKEHLRAPATTRAPTTVTYQQVRHLRWQGAVPKIGLISVVPGGFWAEARVRYAVNKFKAQTYEGAKQLVLVYHHADERTAELVRGVADGSYIRGAAVRGSSQLPSTAAFRYGAWLSDADVIARLDYKGFDSWPNPRRLAMQVKALALSGRPACLLEEQPSANSTAAAASTIVGEAQWMREEWYPLLGEELAVLEHAQSDRVVRLAVQSHHPKDLSASQSTVEKGSNLKLAEAEASRDSTAVRSATDSAVLDEAVQAGIAACASLPEAPPADSSLGQKMEQKLGKELETRLKDLEAVRRDLVGKLRQLCAEATGEQDESRRQQLLVGAGRMAAAEAEQAVHFDALATMLTLSA